MFNYKIIIGTFFITICVGGYLLAPKLHHKYQVWRAEKAIIEIKKVNFTSLPPAPPARGRVKQLTFLEKLKTVTTPQQKLLDVPFICQNPWQNKAGWKIHKESCEEAATLQAWLYLQQTTLTTKQANDEILKMIAWQKQNLGSHQDLFGDAMRQFILKYYNLKPEQVQYIPELNKKIIQKIITLGYPIITPIQGELLKNPFYPYPGYHMLTIIGYTEDRVITNDVGTKRGHKYPYSYERLLKANAAVGGDALVIITKP